jgi:hypothetical protein
MSTLITGAVLLALALWAIGSYGRLVRLRQEVTRRWREVQGLRRRRSEQAAAVPPEASAQDAEEAKRTLEQAERIYELVAARYNAAIAAFPGYLLAALAGFKRAEMLTDAAKVDS